MDPERKVEKGERDTVGCRGLNLIVVALVLFASLSFAARANGDNILLYKDFFFSQPRADIQKIPGVKTCDNFEAGALCRERQPFAGFDWLQAFTFLDNNLVQVTLVEDFSQDRYVKVVGAIHNNGLFLAHLQSGAQAFDFAAHAKSKGKDAAVQAMNIFEKRGLNDGQVIYTFIPNDTVPILRDAGSFAGFLPKSPGNMRTVEMEIREDIGGPWIAIRFFATKAAEKLMGQKIIKSKDSF